MCFTIWMRCTILFTVISNSVGTAEGSCTFTCKVHDSSAYHHTVWEVSEAMAPYGGCPLLHELWPNMTTECGSFHGQATEESPSQCFVSEFSATATKNLNSTSVTCFYVVNGHVETKGSGLLEVIGTYMYILHCMAIANILLDN